MVKNVTLNEMYSLLPPNAIKTPQLQGKMARTQRTPALKIK